MKKEKSENISDILEDREDDGADSETVVQFSPKKNTPSSRKKSGSCGLGVIGKGIFSFVVFTAVLGGIGFGVVWILDNERVIYIGKEEKPAISDIVKTVDEKIVTQEGVKVSGKDSSASDNGEKSPSSESQNSKSDPAKVAVLVLNAGGPAGSAGKATGILTQAGYASAKAENATIFTYKNVTVYYADDASKADAEKVAETLKKQYPTVTVKKAESADEKKEKIVVMVGA